jgi:hypothetical protein
MNILENILGRGNSQVQKFPSWGVLGICKEQQEELWLEGNKKG